MSICWWCRKITANIVFIYVSSSHKMCITHTQVNLQVCRNTHLLYFFIKDVPVQTSLSSFLEQIFHFLEGTPVFIVGIPHTHTAISAGSVDVSWVMFSCRRPVEGFWLPTRGVAEGKGSTRRLQKYFGLWLPSQMMFIMKKNPKTPMRSVRVRTGGIVKGKSLSPEPLTSIVSQNNATSWFFLCVPLS